MSTYLAILPPIVALIPEYPPPPHIALHTLYTPPTLRLQSNGVDAETEFATVRGRKRPIAAVVPIWEGGGGEENEGKRRGVWEN